MIRMHRVVVVVGGLVVVVVVGGLVVVVVVGGLVVVVVVGGLVVVVDDDGFVVVVDDGESVVVVDDEGFEVVVEDEGLVVEVPDGESVAAVDTVRPPDCERVVVVPGFTVVLDAEEEAATDVVGPAVTVGSWESREVAEVTATEGGACIKAGPPAAVVPSATDPATSATWEPATTTFPRLLNWLMIGTSNSQVRGPMTQRWRPSEMFRNALTTAGSNWVPAQRVSSLRASRADMALLYERMAVMTSNESATATIRAPREI